jgi:Secretion system C-terminal sorting domain
MKRLIIFNILVSTFLFISGYPGAARAWESYPAPTGHPSSVFPPHVAIWDNSTIIFPIRSEGILIYQDGEWFKPAMNGFPLNNDTISVLPDLNYALDLDNPWYGKSANIDKIVTHKDRPNNIWCLERKSWRIYHSSDLGENWSMLNDNGLDNNIYDFDLHPDNPDTMVVSQLFTPWISYNGSELWERLLPLEPEYYINPFTQGIQFNPARPDEIILVGHFFEYINDEESPLGGVIVSDLEGDILRVYEELIISYSDADVLVDTSGVGRVVRWSLNQGGIGRVDIYEGIEGIHRGIGGGGANSKWILGFNDSSCDLYMLIEPSTIRHYPPGLVEEEMRELQFNPIPMDSLWIAAVGSADNEEIFLTTNKGIIQSSDSGETGSWVEGLPTTTTSCNAVDSYSDLPSTFSWGESGLFHNLGHGQSWNRILIDEGMRGSFSPDGSEFHYYTRYGEFIRLTLFGEEISRTSNNNLFRYGTGLGYDEEKILLLSYHGFTTTLWESSDGGENWYTEWNFLGIQLDIHIDPQNSDIRYISGMDFYSSDDGGVSWTYQTLPDTSRICPASYAGFSNDLECITATDAGLFRTFDGGATWETISTEFKCLQTYSTYARMPRAAQFFPDPEDEEGFILLETGKRLWKFDSAADTLIQLQIPVGVLPSDLTQLSDGGYLLAASDGRLFRTDILLDVPEWEEEKENLPENFSLSVNLIPNPFNNSQIIDIEGLINREVEITIYAINGRLIGRTKLVAPKAHMRVPFSQIVETESLASGVYLINIKSGKQNKTLKSTLLH